MKYFFLFMVTITIYTHAQAQVKSKKISWHSSVSVNMNLGDSLKAEVSFTSDATKVEMIQGEYTMPFTIHSVEGVWEAINQPGKLTCQVVDDSATPGIITLGKDEKGLYIILDMTPGNPDGIYQRFAIDTYNELN